MYGEQLSLFEDEKTEETIENQKPKCVDPKSKKKTVALIELFAGYGSQKFRLEY